MGRAEDLLDALVAGAWAERRAACEALMGLDEPPLEALFALAADPRDQQTAAWAALALLGLPESWEEDAQRPDEDVDAYIERVTQEGTDERIRRVLPEQIRVPLADRVDGSVVAAVARAWGSDHPDDGFDPRWRVRYCLETGARGPRVLTDLDWRSFDELLDASREPALLSALGLDASQAEPHNPAPSHITYGFAHVAVGETTAKLSRLAAFAAIVTAGPEAARLQAAVETAGYALLAPELLALEVAGLSIGLIGPAREHTLGELLFPIVAG